MSQWFNPDGTPRWPNHPVNRLYTWVWAYLLQRDEPFTCQLTRIMLKFGSMFWFSVIGAGAVLGAVFVSPGIPNKILAVWMMTTLAWLSGHLVQYGSKNPL